MVSINSTIGNKSHNIYADVLTIQNHINKKKWGGAILKLKEDGVCGNKTIEAIKAIQKFINDQQSQRQIIPIDGIISPSGPTFRYLKPFEFLGTSSNNFKTYDKAAGLYGTANTIFTIKSIAEQFLRWQHSIHATPLILIQIGDISFEDGKKMYEHHSHRIGCHVDIRPISKNKNSYSPTKINDKDYDHERTKKLAEIILSQSQVLTVLFNDKSIPGVKSYAGHDDHLHIKLKL